MSEVTVSTAYADEADRTITMRLHPGVTVQHVADAIQGQVDVWTKPEEEGQVPAIDPGFTFATFMNLFSDPSWETESDLLNKVFDRVAPAEGEDADGWPGLLVGVNLWGMFPSDYATEAGGQSVESSSSGATVTVEYS